MVLDTWYPSDWFERLSGLVVGPLWTIILIIYNMHVTWVIIPCLGKHTHKTTKYESPPKLQTNQSFIRTYYMLLYDIDRYYMDIYIYIYIGAYHASFCIPSDIQYQHVPTSYTHLPITLWLFNIAMENSPFIDDFPIKTSIYGWDFPWLCES